MTEDENKTDGLNIVRISEDMFRVNKFWKKIDMIIKYLNK